tara:strand:- start:47 stop:1063 length:1017 start_codon:yes stop_codon:yes gene_type:complete
MKSNLIYILSFLVLFSCKEKEVVIIPVKNVLAENSKRGLFAVNEHVIWTSGTDGIILSTSNNKDWKKFEDTALVTLDFRDIHAFNEKEAVIMSSGDGCEMYKTTDGGKNWKKVYENKEAGIFFDGMDFWDDKNGIAFSDLIDNHIYMITTTDGGSSWSKLNSKIAPKTLAKEAGFAASGTGIVCVGDSTVYIGTGGGEKSRVFKSHDRGLNWKTVNTPMRTGEASGIYSMVFLDELNGVVVGGNYLDSAGEHGNCAITSDGGLTWQLPNVPPTGYRSCVAYNGNGVLITTGRNGIDVSFDKGMNWKHVSDAAYYSCVINGNSGWLTGRAGKFAQLLIK